jgi:hypothetical protein
VTDLIRTAGPLAVLVTLLLVLVVTLLRLAAWPLAGAVLALDAAADLLSDPLSLPAPTTQEGTR